MICPTCKGSGTQTTTVSTWGKPEVETFEIDCLICRGAGEVSKQEYKNILAEQEMWCDCGNPSGNGTYQDGTPEMKHHWTCDDCGKIKQIG